MVPGRRADLRGAGGALSPAGRAGTAAQDGRGRVFVIFNPASGRGRGRKRIPAWLRLLERHLPGFGHAVTEGPGDEGRLAERAVDEGYDTVVAAGGDGTWSQVADRVLASGREGVRFGVLPSGTGNDFGRNLGVDYGDMEAAVRTLVRGSVRRIDVGRVRTPCRPAARPGEAPGPRHFLNLVGLGFDVAVIDHAARARFLKGELLYKVTALQQLFRYPGFEAGVRGAGGHTAEGRHLMITVSNGRFFGGGFPIAPGAAVDDGRLHACLIADAPPLTRFRLFNAAERGRHVGFGQVRIESDTGFRVAASAPVRFEVDGDIFVSDGAELEVEILPGRLPVVTP